ncbi:alpha/beta hydrolase [Nocardioides aestuarii]|uniref:Alpha/beta fold hydrolase n=1 Tax=Nocardioides aestuarii TaxID=252231 RepID=A0ABW4TLU5_9ACTN
MSPSHAVSVEGTPVEVLDVGVGPPVLLLHGSGPGTTGSGAWGTTAEALAGRWRLVAPDQAGFGGSPLPPGARGGLRVWTDRAAALMEALGLGSYAVVGHSMGGAVALALAASRPQQVTQVVAVSTMGAPGAPLSPALDMLWGTTPGESGARAVLQALVHDESHVTDAAVRSRAAAIEAGAPAYAALFPPPRQRWVDDLTLPPALLAAVIAPVLLIHGADDEVTPLATATSPLVEHLPDVRVHVLDRCGHVPQLEHPDAFQGLLAGFLDDEPS